MLLDGATPQKSGHTYRMTTGLDPHGGCDTLDESERNTTKVLSLGNRHESRIRELDTNQLIGSENKGYFGN